MPNCLRWCGLVLLACWAAGGQASTEERPTALCPLVKAGPVLDGLLSDAAWKGVPVNRVRTDHDGKRPAEPPMQFRLCTDGRWLYLFAELADPDTKTYDLKNRGKDACDFSHETLEIFLAPYADAPLYFQFALEPGGADFDNQSGGNAKDHNFGWKHAQKVAAKGWTAEIALPLADLGRKAVLQPGDALALNVCRETRGPVPLHAWSPTHGQFHNRDAFGEVVVGSYAAPALALVKELKGQLAAARAAVPATGRATLDNWAAEVAALERAAAGLKEGTAWRAFRAQGELARRELQRLALSSRGLVAWEVTPWSLPPSTALPAANVTEVEEIRVQALQGECLARAVALANTAAEPVQVRCFSTDLLSPDWRVRKPARDHLTLHAAIEVGLRGGGRQRDALPQLRLEDPLSIPSGRNAVLWLNLDTHGLQAGTWTAGLTLQPVLDTTRSRIVRVVVEVLPAEMPQGPRPYSCGWTNLAAQPCVRYPEECVADERKHYTSVHMVSMGLHALKYDAQGRLLADQIDFSGPERALQRYGTKGQIYILSSIRYEWLPQELGGGGKWTALEQDNFARLVKAIRRFYESKGLSVRDFAYYAMDEPSTEKNAEDVVNFGKLLQAADPEQQIFVTVYNAVTLEALKMMAPYVNLWVPSLGLSDEQRAIVEKTHPEWRRLSYSVIGRSGHPYWNYRANGITAYARGYEGVGFWNYNDCGGSADSSVWDDNDGTVSDYAVIYEGSDGPVTSVRWEGWRQGIQDYRYCEWLTALAAQCPDAALAAEGRKLVAELLERYSKSGETTTADEIIGRMRPAALRLLVAAGKLDAAAVQAAASSDLPFCLTANAGPLGRNLRTRGHYSYNHTPSPDHYGERSGIKEGPVYFQGADAPTGTQAQNKADGDLTDGLTAYPVDYSIHWWPPATWTVTFDLLKPYRLSHLHVLGDQRPFRALVSATGADGSWQAVSQSDTPRKPEQLAADGTTYLGLGNQTARFVRLEISTGGEGVRLGEVRLWGWPAD